MSTSKFNATISNMTSKVNATILNEPAEVGLSLSSAVDDSEQWWSFVLQCYEQQEITGCSSVQPHRIPFFHAEDLKAF